MTRTSGSRREQIRTMLADLKLPGALEAIDGVLARADGGQVTASEAIHQLLDAQVTLRNNRRLQTAMRSSRLPAIKTLEQFDFSFQPSIHREFPCFSRGLLPNDSIVDPAHMSRHRHAHCSFRDHANQQTPLASPLCRPRSLRLDGHR